MNFNTKVSRYFTLHEALFLKSWNIYHIPTEKELEEISNFAKSLDLVRDLVGLPFIVHCWIRPLSVNNPESKYHKMDYNSFVGSKNPNGAHPKGRGCDFHVKGYELAEDCGIIRRMIVPHLEKLKLRMENLNGTWIHIDNLPKINERFFKP